MDRSGRLVVQPQFDWALDFAEGLAAVGVGGKRDAQGDVTMMDGAKWGFIDKEGNIVIPPQFDEVEFSYDRLRISIVWNVEAGHDRQNG